MPDPSLQSYFFRLAEYSTGLLDRLPIEREPQPLEYALGKLAPVLEKRSREELPSLRQLARPKPRYDSQSDSAMGLNTVGMLTDRFTILLIKEWCLRNKAAADPRKADDLYRIQTLDIISALADARPGSSSLNSKITSIESGVSAVDWEESFWGLFTTNLLIWESQELLYLKDIANCPYEELREYISWFSRGNIQRNAYIQLCDKRFWQQDGIRNTDVDERA